MHSLYDYFEVQKDCTDRELVEAYEKKSSEIMFAYINGQISKKQMEHSTAELTNIFKFLSKERAWYDRVMEIDKELQCDTQILDDVEDLQLENDTQDDEDDQVLITIPKHVADGFGMELLELTLPITLVFIGAGIFISDRLVSSICLFFGALCTGVSIGKYVLFRSMMKGDKND